jgi:CBS domain containing-hemolysin-like protein
MSLTIIIIFTILFSAFFSGMETAFISANKMSLEVDKHKGNLTANLLNIFSANSEQYLATMLVGNTISLVVYGLAITRILEPKVELYVSSEIMNIVIQIFFSTLIILLTVEFIPKTLFRINANWFLKFFSFPVLLFYILLYPTANFSMLISKWIIKFLFKKEINPETEKSVFSKIDLDQYVNQSEYNNRSDNTKEDTGIELFKNALDFSKVKVRDCMVPRTEIEAIDITSTIEELRIKFIESGFSKILIYSNSFDNLVGYVHSSQMFKNPLSIKNILNTISIVPETMSVSNLLSNFTQKHKTIAVVVDEFGGTSGLVTTEDILEEIFGEIEDEHDTDDLVIKKLNDGKWILSARYEISYLNGKHHFNLPESSEYETIAGLILNFHESIPKKNSMISIGCFEFRVLKASETRIELVLMKIVDSDKN